MFRLAASAPRTSAPDCSSGLSAWPTPTTRDWKDGGNPDVNVPLNGLLGRVAWLAGWPTPSGQMDAGNTGTAWEERRERVKEKLGNGNGFGLILPMAAQLAGWPTAVANDATGSTHCYGRTNPDGTREMFLKLPGTAKLTGPARLTASGEMLTGSDAGMESGGQLSPLMSAWLMGFSEAWDRAAIRAAAKMKPKRGR